MMTSMPIFEYVCSHCGHRFDKLVRNSAGDQPDVTCPECRSERSQRVLSAFAVNTQGTRAEPRSAPVRIGGG
jgi:putative FmdB family regulatory protein